MYRRLVIAKNLSPEPQYVIKLTRPVVGGDHWVGYAFRQVIKHLDITMFRDADGQWNPWVEWTNIET